MQLDMRSVRMNGTGSAPIPPPLRGELPFGRVSWEAIGAHGAPAVAVLGGISASAHLAATRGDPVRGWWEAQVGRARAVDTRRYRAIGMDYLGATLTAGERVPAVTPGDQANALAAALDHLGVPRLHAVVGASYGGMVALAFAARFPERLDRLVVISAAHQPHPMATAVRSVQRRIVREAVARGEPADGVRLARALAMTTYRTDREFAARFGTDGRVAGDVARFEVDDYLDHCGDRYAAVVTAERFLCLSQSIDLHRIDPAAVTTPTTLVAVPGDPIAPPWQMRELAARLGGPCTLHELHSVYGHDAFLKEEPGIGSILTTALDSDR